MTVNELIKQLRNIEPSTEIVMSKDAEGNDFSPLADVCFYYTYIPTSTWSGDIINLNLSNEELEINDEQRKDFENEKKVVTLWPTN